MSAASRLAQLGVSALRWRLAGEPPVVPRAVVLAAPHTANMDGLLVALLTRAVGLDAHWMVKDTWTRAPVGWFTKPVGAIPVNRRAPGGLVGDMVDQFRERDRFHLIVPPEGTRRASEYWKSGFYRIALEADVPVVPGFLDYRTKRGGFLDPIDLTGDVRADMDMIRAAYGDAGDMARHPDQFGPIRLRDEDGDTAGAAS